MPVSQDETCEPHATLHNWQRQWTRVPVICLSAFTQIWASLAIISYRRFRLSNHVCIEARGAAVAVMLTARAEMP